METRRRPRSDAALSWWASLNGRPQPPRPARLLAAALGLSAALAAAAMPPVWHRLIVPNPLFYGPSTTHLLNGLEAASWLLAVAVIAVGLGVRTFLRTPGPGLRVGVFVLAFATLNGMFIDYFDWSRRGVSLQVNAYFGPGFYVGLSSAGALVISAILAWRARS